MDVQDALKSYKSKEEKLEILKDPHIGAFAVIRLVIYGLIWIAALSCVCGLENVSYRYLFFIVFALARSIMGMLSLILKKAKKSADEEVPAESVPEVATPIAAVEPTPVSEPTPVAAPTPVAPAEMPKSEKAPKEKKGTLQRATPRQR